MYKLFHWRKTRLLRGRLSKHQFLALIMDTHDCKRVALRISIEETASSFRLFTRCLCILFSESALSNFRLQFAMLKLLVCGVSSALTLCMGFSPLCQMVQFCWRMFLERGSFPDSSICNQKSFSLFTGMLLNKTDGAGVSRIP